jgi:hypothetical protein
VTVQTAIVRNEIEHARRECMIQLALQLFELGCKCMVFERRRERQSQNSDSALFNRAKTAGLLSREAVVHFGHPSAECLLWGPDVVGWALRRYLALGETVWLEPLLQTLSFTDVSLQASLTAKGLQPAAANGYSPEESDDPEGEGIPRSSEDIMARYSEKGPATYPLITNLNSPALSPAVVNEWLRRDFPKIRK